MTVKAILPAALALALGAAGSVHAQGTTSATPGNTGSTMGAPRTTAPTATPPTPMTPNATNGAPVVSGPNSATNNAVSTKPQNNAGAPVPGANSFTRGEAENRIAAKGFSQVSDLKLDQQGVWRGMAKKDGQSVNVSLDYQGNVVAK